MVTPQSAIVADCVCVCVCNKDLIKSHTLIDSVVSFFSSSYSFTVFAASINRSNMVSGLYMYDCMYLSNFRPTLVPAVFA